MMKAILGLCLLTTHALAATFPTFRAVDVDSGIQIGYGVAAADVDGDGKRDIVLADRHQIVWYQNPSWQKHVIAERLTEDDHVCIAAKDIDGDGKAEIAAGAGWNPGDTLKSGSVHYLLPPPDRTQKWHPIALPHEPTVHRMHWVRTPDGSHDLVVLPLHGRGNKAGAGAGVRILAYKMPPDPTQAWTTELIDDSMHLTHNFDTVKWSRQPGTELLVGGKEGVIHLAPAGKGWERRQIIGNAPGQNEITGVGEVRSSSAGDFVATIEPMHGHQLVIYTRPAGQNGAALWGRQVLDDTLVDGHALACGDLMGLGTDQIVVGWRAMGKPGRKVGIKLFAPTNKEKTEWSQTTVDDDNIACEDLVLADMNGDGRLDIVASGRATRNVRIYYNE